MIYRLRRLAQRLLRNVRISGGASSTGMISKRSKAWLRLKVPLHWNLMGLT